MFLGKNADWQYDPVTCRVTLSKSELKKPLCKALVLNLIDKGGLCVESETNDKVNYICSENFDIFDLIRTTRLRAL